MTEEQVQAAVNHAMAESRRAIDRHGITDKSLQLIQEALGQLARTPGLKDCSALRQLHQGSAAAAVMASEGTEGITLVFVRFPPDAPTPVHDHGSWGVAYVLEGHDRYVHWRRVDDGSDPEYAQLGVRYEKILGPGDSVYWFDPPDDIHCQQGYKETALELVLFGRDAMQATRRYFDMDTGRVTVAKPQ